MLCRKVDVRVDGWVPDHPVNVGNRSGGDTPGDMEGTGLEAEGRVRACVCVCVCVGGVGYTRTGAERGGCRKWVLEVGGVSEV